MSEAADAASGADLYPIGFNIERALDGRDRLTTFFRVILAIPHLILVGGPSLFGLPSLSYRWTTGAVSDGFSTTTEVSTTPLSSGGVMGAVAMFAAIFSWFAILFTGRHPPGLWDLTHMYMRWRVRGVAYAVLLRDEYPPFGDFDYATRFEVQYPAGGRNRLTVGLRPVLVIPHAVVLIFLTIAWVLTTVVAWFAILLTGRYPRGIYDFAVGVMRWSIRVECYLLLMRDEYPPFRFTDVR